ncbi:MAG: hypothetical protein MZV64_03220 [Ignavibacteriales bacterium]|nr:hypothetical protein [Ignavibacteriales bacterium]
MKIINFIVGKEKIAKIKGENIPSSELGITGFSLDEKANGTLVKIKSDKAIATYNSSFRNGILNGSLP